MSLENTNNKNKRGKKKKGLVELHIKHESNFFREKKLI